MKNFTYVAKDTTGRTIKGMIEAEDSEEVLAKIHEQGLFCVSYSEALGGKKKSSYKFKTKALAFYCRQLAAMMTSGLTIVKALDILKDDAEKKGEKIIWQNIFEAVNTGTTLSEALRANTGSFPEFFISMVEAGESSGTLDITMKRLSEYYASANKLNNKIKGATIYPIILGILCIGMMIGAFTFLLPQFASLMGDESKMSGLSKAMFGISNFLTDKWYIILIVLAVLIGGWIYALKTESVRLWFDRVKIKMPIVGPLVVKIYEGRFSRTLSSLYSSGIAMVEALERSSRVLNNAHVDKMFIQVVDEVKQGSPLSQALIRTEIFENMFCSIIYVGEESGALDDMLEKAADFYEEEADAAVERLVSLTEPLLIIVMGGMIGLVLAAVYPMLYSSLEGIENQ